MDLNHTIVPSTDKVASAIWLANIMGLEYAGPMGPFCLIKINEALTLDFDDRREIAHHHYAFQVSDPEFDAIFGRVKDAGIPYGSGPGPDKADMHINERRGGRGLYFDELNGHSIELMTCA